MRIPDFTALGEVAPPRPDMGVPTIQNPGVVGQAMERTGQQAQQTGINLKQILDTADVNNTMANDVMPKINTMMNNFYQLQGKAAMDAFNGNPEEGIPSFPNQIMGVVKNAASGLTGKAAEAVLEQGMSHLDRSMLFASEHVGKEAINYANQTYGAMQSNDMQELQQAAASGDDASVHDLRGIMLTRSILHQKSLGNDPGSPLSIYNTNLVSQDIGRNWIASLPSDKWMDMMNGGSTPADMGGDTVKPYTPQRVMQIKQMVQQPSPYDALFQQYGKEYGVDPQELKLHAAAESGMNPKADNGQSQGLMQLTPATAKALGVKNAFDPAQSIEGAAKLMAQSGGAGTRNGDMTYYGGTNQANWGNNTRQYAENLAAVRSSLSGGTMPSAGMFKGTPAEDLPPDEIATILNKKMPELRAQVETRSEDDIAMAMNGTANPNRPLQPQQFNAVYGNDGPEQYQKYQDSMQLAANIYKMNGLTLQQQNDLIKSNAPVAGEGYAEKSKVYETMIKAQQSIMQARSDDAALYVQHYNPVLQQKFQAASSDPTKVNDYANMLTAAYDHLGIAPQDRNFLPNSVAQDMVQKIVGSKPEEVPGIIEGIKEHYGAHAPDALKDLVTQKLPPLYKAMIAQSNPQAATALASALSIGEKSMLAALPPSANNDLKDALSTAKNAADLTNLDSSLSATGDAGAMRSTINQAVRMTAMGLMARTGIDAKTATEQAIGSFTDQYDFMGVARVPKEDLAQDKMATEQTLNKLTADQLLPAPNRLNLNFTPQQRQDAALHAARSGFWVTTPDDSGLMLRDSNGKAVLLKSGQPLILSFAAMKTIKPTPMQKAREDIKEHLPLVVM